MNNLHDNTPVAAYNADKQELIGVFASTSLVSKYLYPVGVGNKGRSNQKIHSALRTKKRLSDTVLPNDVALRFANEAQKQMMNGEDYVIFKGYPVPLKRTMQVPDSRYTK